MNLNEYQKKAITTKIYDDSIAIPYIALGMCGEVAELYEKVVLAVGKNNPDLNLLSKEAADVVWYVAAWADENHLQLEDIAALKTTDSIDNICSLLDELILNQGHIAELTKKALRDDFSDISRGIYPESKMLKTNIAAANLLDITKQICVWFNINFDESLSDNIEKLASRAKRGVLGGSGDVR